MTSLIENSWGSIEMSSQSSRRPHFRRLVNSSPSFPEAKHHEPKTGSISEDMTAHLFPSNLDTLIPPARCHGSANLPPGDKTIMISPVSREKPYHGGQARSAPSYTFVFRLRGPSIDIAKATQTISTNLVSHLDYPKLAEGSKVFAVAKGPRTHDST